MVEETRKRGALWHERGGGGGGGGGGGEEGEEVVEVALDCKGSRKLGTNKRAGVFYLIRDGSVWPSSKEERGVEPPS